MPTPSRQPFYSRRYRRMASRASEQVIGEYSTSFSLATRLLRQPIRSHIRNLYAVVRIADEIVDGTAAETGASAGQVAVLLDDYEQAVLAAPSKCFHTDPVLHSWACTIRQSGIPSQYVTDFFAAMRRDLHQHAYTDSTDLDEYVYGSAEVIGLMCLRIFLIGRDISEEANKGDFGSHGIEQAEAAARRFGAALQKVNFLRDLREDSENLGRQYLSRRSDGRLTDPEKAAIVAEIREDLACAKKAIPLLPGAARAGVLLSWFLFNELTDRLEQATVKEICAHRIRVPVLLKIGFGLRAVVQSVLMRSKRRH